MGDGYDGVGVGFLRRLPCPFVRFLITTDSRVSFHPCDVDGSTRLPKARHPLVDTSRLGLSGSGSSMPGARDGAGGVGVDDKRPEVRGPKPAEGPLAHGGRFISVPQ